MERNEPRQLFQNVLKDKMFFQQFCKKIKIKQCTCNILYFAVHFLKFPIFMVRIRGGYDMINKIIILQIKILIS